MRHDAIAWFCKVIDSTMFLIEAFCDGIYVGGMIAFTKQNLNGLFLSKLDEYSSALFTYFGIFKMEA